MGKKNRANSDDDVEMHEKYPKKNFENDEFVSPLSKHGLFYLFEEDEVFLRNLI